MKKFLTILLTVVLAVCSLGLFTGCEGDGEEKVGEVVMPAYVSDTFTQFDNTQISSDFKLGVICLHDENSTYDKNFLEAVDKAKATFNLTDAQVIVKTNIPETSACLEAANQLVAQGCKAIFANSFGHEQFMIDAARANPTVQFYHATGTQSKTVNVANYHTAFASIYEGRYLAGVAAGLKLKALYGDDITADEAKIGYVGAHPYAEVISGFTSFYLGVKSVVPNTTMKVKYTNSWYDEAAEKNAALALIADGAKLVSGHADSMGVPTACKEQNIPNVFYNNTTSEQTFVVASKINWQPYFEYMLDGVMVEGASIVKDYTGTLQTGSVVVTTLGPAAAEGTQAVLDSVKAELIAGTRKVFDTANFTVRNAKADTSDFSKAGAITMDADGKLTAYNADIIDLGDFIGETNAIENGIFTESSKRSAPYFDIIIDGISIMA